MTTVGRSGIRLDQEPLVNSTSSPPQALSKALGATGGNEEAGKRGLDRLWPSRRVFQTNWISKVIPRDSKEESV